MKLNYPQFLTVLLLLATTASFAQQEEKKEEDMYVLSLEQLMNIPIKSASKKEETLFDAPLSSYTITRAEIDKAGSTSIMEALRLSPGVIVREQANGVYDIHIRGMENLTRTVQGAFLKTNTYTLVMIDNRPVFNQGLGGTFWESLPIDINDVDRIEIVRGPSSALFGPNAVTGVINIITKRMDDNKTYVNANVQRGTSLTSIANVSVGRSFSKTLSALVTTNYQDRQRTTDDYYDEQTGNYIPLETKIPDATTRNLRYPHPSRSLNKLGLNGYLTYKPTEKISFDLSASTQSATTQRVFTLNPLQYASTHNNAANLSASIYALKIRTSYIDGYNADLKYAAPNGEYKYKVGDIIAEYDVKLGDKYTVTPGVSYQSVKFDDTDYYDPAKGKFGYFNSKANINTTAGFIRTDLNFTKKFRVLAGLRVDKFSVPDKSYLAYELASTYKLNEKNLIRVAVTRSNSGSFIGYNYLNIAGVQTGDKNLKIFTLNMIELGYRAKLSEKLQLDIDVFQQKGKNLTALLITALPNPPASPQAHLQFANTPTTATQQGVTLSLNYVPSEKIQIKPFLTFQTTKTDKLPSSYFEPALGAAIGAPVTYSSSTDKYTPSVYGGFYFNYRPIAKFNINLSSYYLSKQQQYDASWSAANPATAKQTEQAQIDGKFILNAKVSYEIVKGLNIFFNARNLSSSSHEFYAGDKTKAILLGGASFTFNK